MTAVGNFSMSSYNCNSFALGQDNCFAVGGRVSNSDNSDSSVVLAVGKKVNDHVRLGAFIDQTINYSGAQDIEVDSKVPLIGLMATWNQSPDQSGLQTKVVGSLQKNKTAITRASIGISEEATGDTNIQTFSYLAQASYKLNNGATNIAFEPFTALRYTNTKLNEYTEVGVGAPMAYQDMKQENTSALVGVNAYYQLSPKFSLSGSVGIEHDLNDKQAKLDGSISNASAFDAVLINSNKKNTTASASLGANMILNANQSVEAKLMYQELGYNNDTTTAYITYKLPF